MIDANADSNAPLSIRRRTLLGGLGSMGLLLPDWAVGGPSPSADVYDLTIAEERVPVGGRRQRVITVNGRYPGPLIRLREGREARLRVHNRLRESTSIHWHGLLLPPEMDGVPGVGFAGIEPGTSFEARFHVRQSGTYWYHSHTGTQEQRGLVGPLVIDPARPGGPRDTAGDVDVEHVLVLTDWTEMNPDRILAILKKQSGYFNFQKRTLGDALTARDGQSLKQTMMWGRMRMDPTDIADVTGATYRYLINGHDATENWTGTFEPGQRIRLRIINASAMTMFDFRIEGLPMKVVETDGQPVVPVEVDEFRIGVAETYDVVVEPTEDVYTVFAETMDRSGFARGTLARRPGSSSAIPGRRRRPLLTMDDMAMEMDGMHPENTRSRPAPMAEMSMDTHTVQDDGSMAMPPIWLKGASDYAERSRAKGIEPYPLGGWV